MEKLILTGVDGNLGSQAANYLLDIVTDKKQLIFCGYDPESLKGFSEKGVETKTTDFNKPTGLKEAFKGGDTLALISMPFVGVGKKGKLQINMRLMQQKRQV